MSLTYRMINPMCVVEQLGHFFPLEHHLVGDLEVSEVFQIETVSQEAIQNFELFSTPPLRERHNLEIK